MLNMAIWDGQLNIHLHLCLTLTFRRVKDNDYKNRATRRERRVLAGYLRSRKAG